MNDDTSMQLRALNPMRGDDDDDDDDDEDDDDDDDDDDYDGMMTSPCWE